MGVSPLKGSVCGFFVGFFCGDDKVNFFFKTILFVLRVSRFVAQTFELGCLGHVLIRQALGLRGRGLRKL